MITMTEQEAKLICDVRISRFDHAEDVNQALEIAKQALEEIQQYRAIGTVEECRAYKGNGWIPVKERLPEWEGRYLVTFGNPRRVGLAGYGTCQRDIFGKEIGFGWYDLHEGEYYSRDAIIAWMPLPEPYREEREDCETE